MSKKGVMIGFLFSLVAAIICSIIFTLIAGVPFLVVPAPIAFLFVLIQCIIPFIILFPILGGKNRAIRNASQTIKWVISILIAFIIVLYAGTIGSLSSHVLVYRNSMETLNVDGIITWGIAYAFLLIPLSAPFSRLLLKWFLSICSRYDNYTKKPGT